MPERSTGRGGPCGNEGPGVAGESAKTPRSTTKPIDGESEGDTASATSRRQGTDPTPSPQSEDIPEIDRNADGPDQANTLEPTQNTRTNSNNTNISTQDQQRTASTNNRTPLSEQTNDIYPDTRRPNQWSTTDGPTTTRLIPQTKRSTTATPSKETTRSGSARAQGAPSECDRPRHPRHTPSPAAESIAKPSDGEGLGSFRQHSHRDENVRALKSSREMPAGVADPEAFSRYLIAAAETRDRLTAMPTARDS